MFRYKFYIKNEAGTYVEKSGAKFPFSFGTLLDERLDEAYITVYDNTAVYKLTTEVKIECTKDSTANEDEEVISLYYIVANDDSLRVPNNRERYKHNFYLVERTKLLEGIVCQSQTYTNALGNSFADDTFVVV